MAVQHDIAALTQLPCQRTNAGGGISAAAVIGCTFHTDFNTSLQIGNTVDRCDTDNLPVRNLRIRTARGTVGGFHRGQIFHLAQGIRHTYRIGQNTVTAHR